MIGMTIGNDNYYVMLDKYLLTSDITEGWEAHEQTATEVIGTNDMLNYAHELYKSRTIITKQQEEELINVMMHCMNELASRDILDEEVERAEKIVN